MRPPGASQDKPADLVMGRATRQGSSHGAAPYPGTLQRRSASPCHLQTSRKPARSKRAETASRVREQNHRRCRHFTHPTEPPRSPSAPLKSWCPRTRRPTATPNPPATGRAARAAPEGRRTCTWRSRRGSRPGCRRSRSTSPSSTARRPRRCRSLFRGRGGDGRRGRPWPRAGDPRPARRSAPRPTPSPTADTALRTGHVREEPSRQLLVALDLRRRRQPQQPGPVEQPTARIRPSLLHDRTAAAVASAPNRQNQPRSPGCHCIGAASRCHSRRLRATSSRSPHDHTPPRRPARARRATPTTTPA